MWQSLSTWLKATVWVVVAALLAALFRPVVTELLQALDSSVINKLSPSKLFLAMCGLTVLSLILGLLLYESKRRTILLRDYVADPRWPGTYRHSKQRDLHVCGICLSPLFIHPQKPDLLACNKCSREIVRTLDTHDGAEQALAADSVESGLH